MPELMQYRNYVNSPSNLDPRYSITLRIKALVEFRDVWVEYQDPQNLGRNTSKWETEEFCVINFFHMIWSSLPLVQSFEWKSV